MRERPDGRTQTASEKQIATLQHLADGENRFRNKVMSAPMLAHVYTPLLHRTTGTRYKPVQRAYYIIRATASTIAVVRRFDIEFCNTYIDDRRHCNMATPQIRMHFSVAHAAAAVNAII